MLNVESGVSRVCGVHVVCGRSVFCKVMQLALMNTEMVEQEY